MEVELVIQVEHLQSGEASGGYPLHMICENVDTTGATVKALVLVREKSTENNKM